MTFRRFLLIFGRLDASVPESSYNQHNIHLGSKRSACASWQPLHDYISPRGSRTRLATPKALSRDMAGSSVFHAHDARNVHQQADPTNFGEITSGDRRCETSKFIGWAQGSDGLSNSCQAHYVCNRFPNIFL